MVDSKNLACSIQDVSFSYKGSSKKSLKNISLDIVKGQCVVITGKSGCGKTSLSRLLNGLMPVVYEGDKTGKIFINEKNIDEYSMSTLSRTIGTVFQNPRSQFVNMDTTSEIVFGCETLGFPRQKIQERLDQVVEILGIEHLLGRRVSGLSGGEKQLVILASVFAADTDILLLDEPSASLDIQACQKLATALQKVRKLGKTIIVLEHRLWWLNGLADRIIQLDEGKLIHDWGVKEFDKLSYKEISEYGLRAWSLDDPTIYKNITNGIEKSDVTDGLHALEVKSLCMKKAHSKDILAKLNVLIKPQSAIALIGKNGAGKTTLARIISGITKASSGSITYKSKELDFNMRPKVAYLVMQEPGYQLFQSSIIKELEDAIESSITSYRGTVNKEELISSTLNRFSLNALAHRHPLSLSGGERQRLSIAAGLLYSSPFMILDEPTSGLDAHHMQQLVNQIQALKRNGVGFLIISHDYEFICASCDEVSVLSDGRITEHYLLTQNSVEKLKHQLFNKL